MINLTVLLTVPVPHTLVLRLQRRNCRQEPITGCFTGEARETARELEQPVSRVPWMELVDVKTPPESLFMEERTASEVVVERGGGVGN